MGKTDGIIPWIMGDNATTYASSAMTEADVERAMEALFQLKYPEPYVAISREEYAEKVAELARPTRHFHGTRAAIRVILASHGIEEEHLVEAWIDRWATPLPLFHDGEPLAAVDHGGDGVWFSVAPA